MKSVESLVDRIKSFHSRRKPKPHKFGLLLAIISMFEDETMDSNRLFFNDDLEIRFQHFVQRLDSKYNRQAALIEYPFYYLSKDGCWSFKIRAGKEEDFNRIVAEAKERFTKNRLQDTVEYAILSIEFMELLSNKSSRALLKDTLISRYSILAKSNDSLKCQNPPQTNCYSEYLSSLISTNIFNENAIAESQAINPLFRSIHTLHPLVSVLDHILRQRTGKHVILTGHAGDGKTTIAVDVIKQLRGLPLSDELQEPLERREEVKEHFLSIIKDFSERESSLDSHLIDELKTDRRRFLIVSNTGSLLDFFKDNSQAWQSDSIEVESKILTAISQPRGVAEIEFAGVEFIIYNLAYMDNLPLAEKIFSRMLAAENWQSCGMCSRKEFCPIKFNVEFIRQAQQQVSARLFLMYRRMYEYGGRLTIRQLTSHLAYIICSGISSAHVHKNMLYMRREFLFFNRLFGDDGKRADLSASQMKAIAELKRQDLGKVYNPAVEMNLWLRHSALDSDIVLPAAKDMFHALRRAGAGFLAKSKNDPDPEQARRQLRRLLYFYSKAEDTNDDVVTDFLNSANILNWHQWQKDKASLQITDRNRYKNIAFHVIQEHFTGVKLSEGMSSQNSRIYITLTRKQSEVRQSAQIVIAEFDWEQSINIELERKINAAEVEYSELVLKGRGTLKGISLSLDLPFLDYITQKHYGEMGDRANVAYKERLEHFKVQILKKARSQNKEMTLIRMRNDNSFKRQVFDINDQNLEVYDV